MRINKNGLLVGALSFLLFLQIGVFGTTQIADAQSEIAVPDWIKGLAEFWSDGDISDKEFASAIEYLIQSKIITSERLSIVDGVNADTQDADEEQEIEIPSWIRNNAKWFADGIISDSDFVLGIEYMVEGKIIQSPNIQIIESENKPNEDILVSDSDEDILVNSNDAVPVADSDNDGISDDADACPTQAETVNGFEDSDGCPDTAPLPDKSLTISDVDIDWTNSGWGDQNIYLSWTYHINESESELPPSGHFVIEMSGIVTNTVNAKHVDGNKYAGEMNGIDPGIGGGTITMKIISFIGDEGWNYEGDGDKTDIIIPPHTSE